MFMPYQLHYLLDTGYKVKKKPFFNLRAGVFSTVVLIRDTVIK